MVGVADRGSVRVDPIPFAGALPESGYRDEKQAVVVCAGVGRHGDVERRG
jgi:hypothetical protein